MIWLAASALTTTAGPALGGAFLSLGGPEALSARAFVPRPACISILSPRMGRWADRIGPCCPIAAGSLLVALGDGTGAATVPLQSLWLWVLPGMAVAGVGMALVVAPCLRR